MRLGGNERKWDGGNFFLLGPFPPQMWGFGYDINCGFVVLIFEQGYNGHFINVKIMFFSNIVEMYNSFTKFFLFRWLGFVAFQFATAGRRRATGLRRRRQTEGAACGDGCSPELRPAST
jgi:hypothetical protein